MDQKGPLKIPNYLPINAKCLIRVVDDTDRALCPKQYANSFECNTCVISLLISFGGKYYYLPDPVEETESQKD